jgi:putative transposase
MTKAGVQWRMLPKDFPSWQFVYYYFRKWSYNGLTQQIHDVLISKVREKKGKHSSPSSGLVDSQSVKTASMTKEKGIDGNKKISGRKRFIITDTSRCALSSARPNFAIFITPANTAERQGAQQVFNEMRGEYPLMAKILAHQGFDLEAFVEKVMLTFG